MVIARAIADLPALSLADLEAIDPYAPAGGNRRRFLCPLCGPEHRQDATHRSLSLEVATGYWKCHRCGERGQLRDNWRSMSPRKAALARLKRVTALKPAAVPDAVTDPAPVLASSVPVKDLPGAAYLESRGIPLPLAEAAGVRYHPNVYGKPAIVFPMHGKNGEVIAVNCRFIKTNDQHDKTISLGPRGSALFMTPGAFDGDIVITEGPFDALSLAAIGIPSIALVGTSGPAWLRVKCGLRRVAIALDADKAGDDAAAKLSAELTSLGAQCERWRPQGGKDWNEILVKLGPTGLKAQVRPSTPEPQPRQPEPQPDAITSTSSGKPPLRTAAIYDNIELVKEPRPLCGSCGSEAWRRVSFHQGRAEDFIICAWCHPAFGIKHKAKSTDIQSSDW
jgi:transcription elongation factor Elf1